MKTLTSYKPTKTHLHCLLGWDMRPSQGWTAYPLRLDGLIKLSAVCYLVEEVGAGVGILQLRPVGSHKLPNLLQTNWNARDTDAKGAAYSKCSQGCCHLLQASSC